MNSSPCVDLLSRFIHSPLGLAELEKLEPLTDRAVLEARLADVAEAIEYLRNAYAGRRRRRAGRPSGCVSIRIPDIEKAVSMLRIEGAGLEARQIFDLTSLLEQAGEIRSILTTVAERYPRLGAKAPALVDLRPVLRELRGKILARWIPGR